MGSGYRDEAKLRELYHGEKLSLRSIADRYGVCAKTIQRWMDKYGIERRERLQAMKIGPAPLQNQKQGYLRWETNGETVYVHQLVAISNGHSPSNVFSEEFRTHHKNGLKWDNRHGNITIVSMEEHFEEHNENGDYTEFRNEQKRIPEKDPDTGRFVG